MLIVYLATGAVAAYIVGRWWAEFRRAYAELPVARVRVADLPAHIGARVRFRHPTRRREYVEGYLVAARESLLSLAWLHLTIEHPDHSRTDYEVATRGWAYVTRQ